MGRRQSLCLMQRGEQLVGESQEPTTSSHLLHIGELGRAPYRGCLVSLNPGLYRTFLCLQNKRIPRFLSVGRGLWWVHPEEGLAPSSQHCSSQCIVEPGSARAKDAEFLIETLSLSLDSLSICASMQRTHYSIPSQSKASHSKTPEEEH